MLKSLPCCVTAVGNPARIVGRSKCSSAANNMDLALHNVQYCLDLNQMIQKVPRFFVNFFFPLLRVP